MKSSNIFNVEWWNKKKLKFLKKILKKMKDPNVKKLLIFYYSLLFFKFQDFLGRSF